MHGALAETIAILALAATLIAAVSRPFGWSEAVLAVPMAGLLVALDVEPASAAVDRLKAIGPTVGFLAAILVFGHLCAQAQLFDYLGTLASRASRADPRRLLLLVVMLAAGVTAVLTLDATVVLLTPVVLAAATRLGVSARAPAYACVRLANSGSLLLPVSNLTNLLAFTACGLSFGRFAALMVLPWLLACAGEWLSLRVAFRAELVPAPQTEVPPVAAPRYALVVLALTVAGFVITSSVHVAPAWAAVGGCVLLLAARPRDIVPRRLIASASPGFCAFVLALAVVVDGVTRHGLSHALAHVVPSGDGLPALLGMAFAAALLANLVNNLPATLALVPLIAGQPVLALAMLLGVNIGPNATYGGSLATLLWRRLLPEDAAPRAREFHALGLATVPLILALTTVGLWASVRVLGV
ncbi:SLC13 family permease [Jatrophihabitans sp.]|uniref:SLC13 family permease n=1 Tax=Jatrophihabitans sp. TaxID=1932789 RepID=UPI0030C6BDD7